MRAADPRAAAAAFLSFVVPGFGQAYNGRWGLAALLALPVLLLAGLVIGIFVAGSPGGLARLLDARVLVALVVLDVALLGWRLVAIVQAHVDRGTLRLRSWPTWLTAILVAATLAMHLLPAWYAAKAIDTLGAVSLEGGGSALDERIGHDVSMPPPSDQPEVGLGERVTVLLVGIDFAPGRDNHLTDTMLVATLEPEGGDAAMVSVPRDLYGVPLGDGRVFNAKLNSLMSVATDDPAGFPRGGLGTLKAAVGELLGTPIHYVAAIDIEGMREVVDTIGGVDVTVERAITDPQYHDTFTGQRGFFIEAGPHHLDGATAMAYVRSRLGAGDSDFTRAARQQQVLTAIAQKLTAGNLLTSLPGLLDAVKGNVTTDIPTDRFADIAAEIQSADLGAIQRVVLTPDEGYVAVEQSPTAGYILHPNLEAIRELAERIFSVSTAGSP